MPKDKIDKDKFISLLVEIMIEYIQQEYNPDEIFERDKLDEWIYSDGWIRPKKESPVSKKTAFFGEHINEAIHTIKEFIRDKK